MKFSDLATIRKSTVHPQAFDGYDNYLGFEHFAPGTLRFETTGDPASVSSMKQEFLPGDTIYGKLRPYFRKVGWSKDLRGICSTDLWVFKPKPGVDPRFVFYVAGSQEFTDLATQSSEGTRMPRASWSVVKDFEVLDFTLGEQRAIAATLGALDDKIESNRRAISLIDELVRKRFEANFDLTHVSDGVSIAELVTVNRRLKLSRGSVSTYIGMSSLPPFSPSVLDWEKREFGSGQKFMNGDVLMARITPCLENGKTAIVDMLQEGEVGWGSTEYVVLGPKGAISTPWIYALVRHPDLREWAVRRMSGTSGRQRFQADSFDDYIIREPDSIQLDGFNSFALPLFEQIAQMRDEVKKLASVRDTLLPALLSGEVRVPAEGVEA